ncbi:MAG: 50S ribosomal protein L29, partial [Candidatus Paceibacterota bacterium]
DTHMAQQNYTDMSESDLIKTLGEKRAALREFRFNIAGTKTRDVKEGRNLRKDVARILTALHQRDRAY